MGNSPDRERKPTASHGTWRATLRRWADQRRLAAAPSYDFDALAQDLARASFSVNMSKIAAAGEVDAPWIDPRIGEAVAAGRFSNTGV